MARADLVDFVKGEIALLREYADDMEKDLARVEKGQKAPGVRIRKTCQDVKQVATGIRGAVLELNKTPVE